MARLRYSLLFLRAPRGLLAGAICALLVGGLFQLGGLDGAERSALDRLFQARDVRSPDPRITILVADDATVGRVARWPLPRGVYAKAIQKLTQAGVHTIACDVLFSVASYSASEDAQLAKACRESQRVVQAAAFHVPLIYNPVVPVTLTSDRRTLPSRFAIKNLAAQCRAATWASSALPELQESAPAVGHINVHPELDGTLRHIPHLIRYKDQIYPSLALAATAHFLGLKPDDIIGDADAVRLAPADGIVRHMPLDQNGEAWVNWAGGNDTFPTYNFNQLFDGHVPAQALKDRLVIIGVTAAGAFEYRPTPFSPVQPAVEVQANAISDLLSNRPLREASTFLQLSLLLGFSLLVGVLAAPRRALAATLWLLLLLTALWEIGVWCLRRDFYLPLSAPALSGLLTYSLVIAANYRREWESNWRTDASVAALARGGSLMASGRERELLLTVIRRTAREVLQARDVLLVIKDGEQESQLSFHPAYAHRLPMLAEASQRVTELGRVVLWRVGVAASSSTEESLSPVAPDPVLRGVLEQLSDDLATAHKRSYVTPRRAFESILVAPLFGGTGDVTNDSQETPHARGVLVATGRRDGQMFSERDAILLQTLAEQASLALDNLGYYERLRGRVELANRSLREAYDVLSEERALLSEERTKLAAAVESMESALVISDENDIAVFDNGMGVSSFWGASPAMGRSMPGLLHEHGLPELAALFDQIKPQSSDEAVQKAIIETTRLAERGLGQVPERSILSAQLTPLIAADGHYLGSMLVVADVTAERELEKMKSDFVAFVAHELRTPLTSINGFATLLKLNSLKISPEQRDDLLTSIEGQCSRLNRMISDLLEIARLEPGRGIEIHCEKFDLAALCDKVFSQLRVLITDPQKLTLEIRCESRPLWVNLDPDRVEQILINLISNAIKYSPDGGRVTLLLSEAADQNIGLQIRDTGMGMTPDQVAHLFQKYYRAPDAQARGIQGTGLGLYLVKHLVEAHDGSIEVESKSGQGTTFSLTLPAALP